MKKIILWIVVAILAVGAVVGAMFGIKYLVNNKNNANENNTVHVARMLETSYNKGENIIFDLDVFSDLQFTSISYKLDNTASVTLSAKTGNAEDHEDAQGKGKYFIDTGAEIIETEEISEGYHTLVFYGTIADGTVYQINETPYIFQIVAVQAA